MNPYATVGGRKPLKNRGVPVAEDPNPNAADEALLERLGPRIHSLINSALASHNKQADKKREQERTDLQAAFAKMLDEKFQALKPADDPADGKKEKDGKRGDNVEIQTMRKELADLRQRAESAEQERQKEREKNRSMSLRTEATRELEKHGVSGNHARIALSAFLQEGRVGYESDLGEGDRDALLFRSDDGTWVDLNVGLKSWVKTPDAKIFLPPAGAAGSGSRPPARDGNPPQKLSPEEQRRGLGEALNRLLE